MIAVAVFVAWAAYGLGIMGLSLIKGWNLGFKDIWSPVSFYSGKWPPALAGDCSIIPTGTAASLASSTSSGTSSTSSSSSGSGGSGSGAVPSAPSGISSTAAIQKAAAMFGWGSGTQWNCLTQVITLESGGNPSADNPSSGAYGIAQALGHGTSGSAGCGRNEYGAEYGLSAAQAALANCGGTAGAFYQAVWMMGYIKAAYGTPCGALAHENEYHWY